MFTEKQQRSYDQNYDFFRSHGYWIAAEPIEGMEEVFLNDLRETRIKLQNHAQWIRERYGYRGMSKNLIRQLNKDMPNPSFNVQVIPE